MLWYPIKQRRAPDLLANVLRRLGTPKILRVELMVAPLDGPHRLGGCDLILADQPWMLAGELSVLLPALATMLSRHSKGTYRLDWLAS